MAAVYQQMPPQPPPVVYATQQPQHGPLSPGQSIVLNQHTVTVERYLSQGGFAHVYLVRSPTPIEGTTQHVLKRIAVSDDVMLKEVKKEVDVMRVLKGHPNIVHLIDAKSYSLGGGRHEVYILMEFCSGGGIIDMMNRRLRERLTEHEILQIFVDVLEAVAYMHNLNPALLHRDLKVENILQAGAMSFKLCDFGSAATVSSAPTSSSEVRALEMDLNRHTTLQYRAPEMVDPYLRRPIDEKSDVWALGVLLYKLCYYTTPFEEHGQLAILNVQYKFPPYPVYSQNMIDLIRSMLRDHGTQRPSVFDLLGIVHRIRGTSPLYRYNPSPTFAPSSIAASSSITSPEHPNASPRVGLNHPSLNLDPTASFYRFAPSPIPAFNPNPPASHANIYPAAGSASATAAGTNTATNASAQAAAAVRKQVFDAIQPMRRGRPNTPLSANSPGDTADEVLRSATHAAAAAPAPNVYGFQQQHALPVHPVKSEPFPGGVRGQHPRPHEQQYQSQFFKQQSAKPAAAPAADPEPYAGTPRSTVHHHPHPHPQQQSQQSQSGQRAHATTAGEARAAQSGDHRARAPAYDAPADLYARATDGLNNSGWRTGPSSTWIGGKDDELGTWGVKTETGRVGGGGGVKRVTPPAFDGFADSFDFEDKKTAGGGGSGSVIMTPGSYGNSGANRSGSGYFATGGAVKPVSKDAFDGLIPGFGDKARGVGRSANTGSGMLSAPTSGPGVNRSGLAGSRSPSSGTLALNSPLTASPNKRLSGLPGPSLSPGPAQEYAAAYTPAGDLDLSAEERYPSIEDFDAKSSPGSTTKLLSTGTGTATTTTSSLRPSAFSRASLTPQPSRGPLAESGKTFGGLGYGLPSSVGGSFIGGARSQHTTGTAMKDSARADKGFDTSAINSNAKVATSEHRYLARRASLNMNKHTTGTGLGPGSGGEVGTARSGVGVPSTTSAAGVPSLPPRPVVAASSAAPPASVPASASTASKPVTSKPPTTKPAPSKDWLTGDDGSSGEYAHLVHSLSSTLRPQPAPTPAALPTTLTGGVGGTPMAKRRPVSRRASTYAPSTASLSAESRVKPPVAAKPPVLGSGENWRIRKQSMDQTPREKIEPDSSADEDEGPEDPLAINPAPGIRQRVTSLMGDNKVGGAIPKLPPSTGGGVEKSKPPPSSNKHEKRTSTYDLVDLGGKPSQSSATAEHRPGNAKRQSSVYDLVDFKAPLTEQTTATPRAVGSQFKFPTSRSSSAADLAAAPSPRQRPQSMFLSPTTPLTSSPSVLNITKTTTAALEAPIVEVPNLEQPRPKRNPRRGSISDIVLRYEALGGLPPTKGGGVPASPVSATSPAAPIQQTATKPSLPTKPSGLKFPPTSSSTTTTPVDAPVQGDLLDLLPPPSPSKAFRNRNLPVDTTGAHPARKRTTSISPGPTPSTTTTFRSTSPPRRVESPVNSTPLFATHDTAQPTTRTPSPPPPSSPERPYQGVGRLIDQWQKKAGETSAPNRFARGGK